jgi:UDP-2,4-diacetamido-2,4,6-trideoxy-beta-L-altropyranose hydrolase
VHAPNATCGDSLSLVRPQPPNVARRLAVRCDGGAERGAGHVARCLPLAQAFASIGWSVTFVGRYDGLAAWLLGRAAVRVELPTALAPCGLEPELWDAAIVDLYAVDTSEICELARRLPIATLGEASRCDSAGVLIDYHLDRIGGQADARVLPGPAYAPLDPAFAGAGRAGEEVQSVLVTVGGSEQALRHVPELRRMVKRYFPDAEQLVAPGNHAAGRPVSLLDLVGRVDLAVSAAGLTTYELACAGIPQAAVAIVANQSRVLRGLRQSGLAPGVDLSAGEGLGRLDGALERLRDRDLRRVLSELGRATFDGRGAARAAESLVVRWAAERPGSVAGDRPAAGTGHPAPSLP